MTHLYLSQTKKTSCLARRLKKLNSEQFYVTLNQSDPMHTRAVTHDTYKVFVCVCVCVCLLGILTHNTGRRVVSQCLPAAPFVSF